MSLALLCTMRHAPLLQGLLLQRRPRQCCGSRARCLLPLRQHPAAARCLLPRRRCPAPGHCLLPPHHCPASGRCQLPVGAQLPSRHYPAAVRCQPAGTATTCRKGFAASPIGRVSRPHLAAMLLGPAVAAHAQVALPFVVVPVPPIAATCGGLTIAAVLGRRRRHRRSGRVDRRGASRGPLAAGAATSCAACGGSRLRASLCSACRSRSAHHALQRAWRF